MAHTSANVLVHVIFSTKQRRPLIRPAIKSDLHAYLGGIVREMGATALLVNGTGDHVHMLIRMPPACPLADLARVVKTNSSRWIHECWPEYPDFAWQTGYGAFSVSASTLPQVTAYIAKQEEHHRTRSFQEEFVAFLKKNGIAYDERYIWG
jgi:REP element-mobilizing transposase RayT